MNDFFRYKKLFLVSLLIPIVFAGFFYFSKTHAATSLVSRLSGYILLQVEDNGEAWYVIPKEYTRVYMQNGTIA
ncbi:MAG: hypothetical protein WC465_05050, partial [Patescibacteria group bacterium]